VNAEEKVYDDLCSITSSKVDQWLGSGIVKCLLVLLLACYLSVSSCNIFVFYLRIMCCIDIVPSFVWYLGFLFMSVQLCKTWNAVLSICVVFFIHDWPVTSNGSTDTVRFHAQTAAMAAYGSLPAAGPRLWNRKTVERTVPMIAEDTIFTALCDFFL